MKTRMLAVAVALLALMLCGTALLSYAQEPAGPPAAEHGFRGHGPWGHGGLMLRELNLTDAQKQQVKALFKTQGPAMKTIGQQMAQVHLSMLQATSNGAFDQAKIQALAGQQAQLEAQMTVQRQSLEHQIYTTILTPEQRTKADQMRTEQISRVTAHIQKMSQAQSATPEQ